MSQDSRRQNGRHMRDEISLALAFGQDDATIEQIGAEITDETAAAMQRNDLRAETMRDFGIVDDSPKLPYVAQSDDFDRTDSPFQQLAAMPIENREHVASEIIYDFENAKPVWGESGPMILMSHQQHDTQTGNMV